MKKFSISLLSTLAIAAATGIGCSSSSPMKNPGTGGGDGGMNPGALVPNADGFFDGSNSAGIVGAWYSYGDWYGNAADPSMPIAGMGD